MGHAAGGKRSGLGYGGGSTQGWGADVWAGTQRKGVSVPLVCGPGRVEERAVTGQWGRGFDWVGEGAVTGVDIAAASSPETGETGSLGFYRAGVRHQRSTYEAPGSCALASSGRGKVLAAQ